MFHLSGFGYTEVMKIDKAILDINKVICKNIGVFDASERGLLSQNILAQLRNFIEHIFLKAYSQGKNIEITYPNIGYAEAYAKTRGELRFLTKFHDLSQITISHYTLDEQRSERLMLKYYEYLLKIKSYLKKVYGLDVLENIDDFPLNTDSVLKDYYEKIVEKINQVPTEETKNTYENRYYVQRVKPFFVKHEVYYEITFTTVNDHASKFDRIIAFTKLSITPNYAVRLFVRDSSIKILGKDMPVQIIDEWEVSIRPCELNNFARIFGVRIRITGAFIEYKELMKFLTSNGLTLVEVIDLPDENYQNMKDAITQQAKAVHFLPVLDKCRELTKNNSRGSNIVRYLLHCLNNRIIKQQSWSEACIVLSNLNLRYGCIPFDEMPFATSPMNHNPRLVDLFDCIDPANREHEFFARFIKNNNEVKGELYTRIEDIENFNNVESLMKQYNDALYYRHGHRKLETYKGHVYINGYEEDALYIIDKLKELSSDNIKNYSNSVDAWLQTSTHGVDCEEKKVVLKQMFENSRVALIYGSAGTGKSTLINHASNFFSDRKKLYLANTNPAVDNLTRKVIAPNCTFKTIAKFLSVRNDDVDFDLLVIDECSTVSNSDMRAILTKASFKLLILVGDVFQIESIIFGNWFNIAQSFVPSASMFELTKPYRSKNPELLTLWDRVRNIEDDIVEKITKGKYSVTLDESIFEHSEEDEIILCLNYDGLYGINNINKFLQSNNRNPPVQWGIQIYKVNDPILFNETDRFAPLIYNNLKGRIAAIEKYEKEIQFDVEIDKVINEFDAEDEDFELAGTADNGNSIIRFVVKNYNTEEDDEDESSITTIVPFQVAYAVSIHKAQGLEYDSVKVVITDEIEEMISHNIFYTAITRAKEKLKIYWTPETESKVIKSLEKKDNNKDVALLTFRLAAK